MRAKKINLLTAISTSIHNSLWWLKKPSQRHFISSDEYNNGVN
jgi:hypothetical protein